MALIRTICFILILCGSAIADGPYYVDNAASGSNNGTSWTNAWQAFATIDWATVSGGDNRTLYISGGEDNKTYTGTLTPTSSGTTGNPIIIQPGQSSPHNGVVLIDNNYANSTHTMSGISLNGVQYITIDGRVGVSTDPHIRVTRSYYGGVSIKSTGTRYIDIGYIESDTNGEPTSFKQGTGIVIYEDIDCLSDIVDVHHSVFHDSWDDDAYFRSGACTTFGRVKFRNNEMYAGYENSITANLDGVDIYDNWIHGPPQDIRPGGGPHYNCIQTNGTSAYMRIYNNYFDDIPPEGRTTDAPIRFAPSTGNASHIRIFNNIFVSTTALTNSLGDPNTMPFFTLSYTDPSLSGLTDVLVANNTFFGSPGYTIFSGGKADSNSTNTNNIFFYNNLIVDAGRDEKVSALLLSTTGTGMTYGSSGDGAVVTLDNNLFWPGDDGVNAISYSGTTYTYANFKSASGCEDSGVNADPLLDASYIPTVLSPARSAGIDLTSYCTETPALCLDKNGIARPSGSAWDIGAYEYNPSTALKQSLSGGSLGGGAMR